MMQFEGAWAGRPPIGRGFVGVAIGPPGAGGNQEQLDEMAALIAAQAATITALAARIAALESGTVNPPNPGVPGQLDFSDPINSGLI